jgi:hypothetical protein
MITQFFIALLLPAFSVVSPFLAVEAPQTVPVADQVAVCDRPAFEGSRITKGIGVQSFSDTAVADFNNDGRLDIANQSGPFQVLTVQPGIGNGYFGDPVVVDPASATFNLVSADFNNDGNADLLTASKIYLGTGNGGFQQPRLLLLGANTSSFSVGDFNGDDNIDIAGNVFSTRNVEVFFGDGTGRFSPVTVVDFVTNNVDTVIVADMNGDKISDLVATLAGNSVSVAFGSSTGVFGTPTAFPVGGTGNASRLAAGDVDGDNDLDIVTSNVEFFSDTRVTTLLNNGSGGLTALPQFIDSSSNLVRISLADVNSDNKLDLLATNTSGVLVLRLGNQDGTFQATRRLPGIPGQVKMFFEDFTGDGIRDLGVNGTGVGSPLFGVMVNDATGNLGPRQMDITTDSSPIGMATADFNEDGKTDVVTANEQLSFWVGFGDGVGGFGSPISIPVTRTPRAVLTADINNDGNQDIFAIVQNVSEATAMTWVAFGNGNGTFMPATLAGPIAGFLGGRMPALIDFNRDGLLDLATASMSNNRVAILRGFGNGQFVQQRVIDIPGPPRSMTGGDFDQDGFIDLAVLSGSVFVFLNNADFFPTAIGSFPAGQSNSHILASDFNADSKLDLVTTSDTIGGGIGNPGKAVILLGAGNGGFSAPTEYIIGRGASQMATADFDGDGNKDVAVANSGYNVGSAADTRVTVMYGNGAGIFPRVQDFTAANFPKGIGAIDIDTDADMDIVTPDWGQSRLTLLKNICLAPPAPVPALNANADVQVTEGDATDTTITLNVTLSAASSVPVRVNYYTAPFLGVPGLLEGEELSPEAEDLTTAARRDYVSAVGNLLFAPGETSKSVQLTVRGDLIDEYDEYVSFFLSNATNASISDNQTIVRITDNDGPPSISIGDLSAAEGNTGDTLFNVPVTVSTPSEKSIVVQYTTVAGTATPNVDYRFTQAVYTLPVGQATGAVPVNVIGDNTVEPNENFSVQLSDPLNATINDANGAVAITNDDVGGTVQFSAGTFAGNETAGLIPVTISRSGGIGGGVSVRFRTQAGTATPGQDYVENVTTVQFAENETSKTVQVEVLRDDLDEPDETLNVSLDQPSGVAIGAQSTAVVTIVDFETPPNLSVLDGEITEGNSGDTTLRVYLTLSRPTGRPVMVNFATADVTATAGSDYEATSGVFTINPGVTRVPINIVVHGDTTFELNETLQVNLSNAVNASLVDNQAIGTILNDEPNAASMLSFVSINQAGTGSGNSDSLDPAISSDGNIVAFESFASNLAGNDTNGMVDVYVRDRAAGQTRLVSINSAGTNSGSCESRRPVISPNGRFVAFIICAPDLASSGAGLGGFPGYAVFLRDLQTNQTRLVSLNTSGGIVSAFVWALSADGRYLVFQSDDQGVTPVPDPVNTSDLYIRDTVSNTTQLITINATGTSTGNAPSGNASLNRDVQMTPDGRYVLFPSNATDLVTQTPGGGSNYFVRDLVSQTTTAASINAAGTQLVGAATGSGSISSDGRYVFFASTSNAVTPTDPNTVSDVFRRDMQAGSNLLVSVNLAGTGPGNGGSGEVEGSSSGRYVAFISSATDISTSTDTNGLPDCYWRDIESGQTRLVSINAAGTNGGNSHSAKPRISADGQKVLFTTASSDLIAGVDTNVNFDQYLRDVAAARMYVVSANAGGTTTGNQPTLDGVISANGSIVIFPAAASNLLPNDLNGFGSDVFAFSLAAPPASSAPFDFDGDGKTDLSIFRPAVAEWWINRSSTGVTFAAQFGATTDSLVPGDFTGDGKDDIAVWRPLSGEWFILRSEDSSFFSFPFGTNGDTPVVGDFDGDSKADATVFRSSNVTWFIRRSSDNGTTIQQFGAAGDIPVASDYDGDGKTDIAIFRPSLGQWWMNRSTAGVLAVTFGNSSDKLVQGDYTGDGKSDNVFWRPSTGEWFVLRSEDFSFFSFPFGTSTDIPAPGDYDGDGRFDATVFRPSNSTWFSQRTTAGTLIQQFGANGDRPVPNAFVP